MIYVNYLILLSLIWHLRTYGIVEVISHLHVHIHSLPYSLPPLLTMQTYILVDARKVFDLAIFPVQIPWNLRRCVGHISLHNLHFHTSSPFASFPLRDLKRPYCEICLNYPILLSWGRPLRQPLPLVLRLFFTKTRKMWKLDSAKGKRGKEEREKSEKMGWRSVGQIGRSKKGRVSVPAGQTQVGWPLQVRWGVGRGM